VSRSGASASPSRGLSDERLAQRSGRPATRDWRSARLLALAAVVLGLGLLLPTVVPDAYYLGIAVDGAVLGILAVSVGFLMRRCGLVSLGQAAFFGTAAYLVAIATTHWAWKPAVAAMTAVAGGAALSLAIGAIVVRTPGMSFVMLTLAFGQALYAASNQTSARPVTGGFDGLAVRYRDSFFGYQRGDLGDAAIFWPIAWTALVVIATLLAVVGRSRFGVLLEAIRENEERARFSGFDTYWPRVAAFTLSGTMAAIAGVLFALHKSFVSPDLLDWSTSGNALVAAIVGGVGSVAGPALGGFLYIFGRDRFAGGGNLEFYTGVALIAVLVFAPGGLTGTLGRLVRSVRTRLRGGAADVNP
jgi:branched-chain amino acid transport system permease protein